MSNTLTLQNSINFVRPILKMQPLDVTGLEPALTAGNIILQTMLSAPFRWRFNRQSFNFQTEVSFPATTDYNILLPTFGFLETQWITDSTGYPYELNGELAVPVVGDLGRPSVIAPQFDDNEGNITFRLKNAPDAVYTVFMDYQQKPTLMTSFGSPWGVVTDEFSFVFNQGFLALMALLINDARSPIFEQYFISRLLGLQDGLTDQQRLIFLGNWTAMSATLNRSSGSVQSGLAGRSK
jgi:hypothetical protein